MDKVLLGFFAVFSCTLWKDFSFSWVPEYRPDVQRDIFPFPDPSAQLPSRECSV
jgi:hypothetical protein